MADVTTYKRCTMSHHWNGRSFTVGDVLPSSDPATTQNPQWWVALADADFTSTTTSTGTKKTHTW